jgi:hypothetical protein
MMCFRSFPAASLDIAGNGTTRYKATIYYNEKDKKDRVIYTNNDPNEAVLKAAVIAGLLKGNL